MNIGQFKRINGQLVGSIATATIDLPKLGLRPVESTNEKAPAYEICTLNVARRWVQIGALWEQTSNTTGEVFYQGRLDDPSLANELAISLFATKIEDTNSSPDADDTEAYNVVWNRAKPRATDMNGNRQNKRRTADDGFGTGNATDNGQLAHENPDYVPFN